MSQVHHAKIRSFCCVRGKIGVKESCNALVRESCNALVRDNMSRAQTMTDSSVTYSWCHSLVSDEKIM